VSTELRVRNTGDVVDQFAFQPLGDAAAWITVEPPIVRLFPDTDQIVTVTIAPPREPSSKPGIATWAVKAIPQEDPGGAAVGEGTVDVGEFVEVSAELQPVNGRGRLSGKFDIAVDNRGNVPVPVRLAGSDAEQALEFDFSPVALETAPGSAHFSKLSIKPPKRIWRGTPTTHPFQLVVEPQVRASGVTGNGDSPLPVPAVAEDGTSPAPVALAAPPVVVPLAAPPIVLAGNFVQEAIVPKWLWKALLALLALLIALWVLWKTLLEPQVESAARAVAIEEVEEVAAEVETLSTEVEQAEQQAAAAQETADEAAAAAADDGGGAPPTTVPGDGGGDTTTATTVPPATTVPVDDDGGGPAIGSDAVPTNFRLVAAADAGTNGSSAAGVNPEGTTTAITDIILQNPSGDIGFIRVIINGQVIIEAALESFSTQDFHYVAPYVVQPGQAAGIEVSCAPDQIVAGDPCSAAVSFAGYTTTETAG
jgi:outer membrane murein-binding lipoprotein Lpp